MEKKEFENTSLLNRIVNEDREAYLIYRTNKENGVFISQNDNIYLLELLDYMGFDINKPGTYLFRELVADIYGGLLSDKSALRDYKAQIIRNDLNKEKPFMYNVISDRLGIKTEGFYEYVYDATSTINKDCKDTELRKIVLGLNFRDLKPGIMAYMIAKSYEKVRREGYTKTLKPGLVKKIKKKSESI